ncbi:MAG: RnfABCDGE type electron transport complex subunit G [candidate division WOR-3 bacterium]|nr:RnfABCDGE type electron transport complex subunit G [candidate division WOR-3 bacterium]
MKENIIQVIKLVLVCIVAASVLAVVYSVTKEPIEKAKAEEKIKAVRAVISGYEDGMTMKTDTVTDSNDNQFVIYTVIDNQNNVIGRSIASYSDEGYGGTVNIMIGMDSDYTVTGLYVLSHKETPGLGSKMDTDEFKSQFIGLSDTDADISVRKDGGDIDAITSATITSRAVCRAIDTGLKIVREYMPFENHDSEMSEDSIEAEVEDVIEE